MYPIGLERGLVKYIGAEIIITIGLTRFLSRSSCTCRGVWESLAATDSMISER